jgi:hypothetical protein
VWSDETYRIFEYSPRDKVTLDMIVERVHSEDRNFVLETVKRASTKGVPSTTNIWANGAVGRGATFHFTLPASPAK